MLQVTAVVMSQDRTHCTAGLCTGTNDDGNIVEISVAILKSFGSNSDAISTTHNSPRQCPFRDWPPYVATKDRCNGSNKVISYRIARLSFS